MNPFLGSKLSRRGVLKGTAATGAVALLGGIGQANAIAAGGAVAGPRPRRVPGGRSGDADHERADRTRRLRSPRHRWLGHLQAHPADVRGTLARGPHRSQQRLPRAAALPGRELGRLRRRPDLHLPPAAGVKFHDGTDFNAEVVEFNVRRIWDKDFEFYYPRANSFTFYAFEPLDTITVVDDYTVTMQLKRPFAEFLRMQNQSYGEPLMISPESVKTNGNEGFAQTPHRHRPLQARRAQGRRKQHHRALRRLLGRRQGASRQGHLPRHPRFPGRHLGAEGRRNRHDALDPAGQSGRYGEQRLHRLDE